MVTSCVNNYDSSVETEAIKGVLDIQVENWNKGDIEGFMMGYIPTEELMFIGNTGIKKGWNNTLERYKTTYSTREKMGTLKFDIIKVDILDHDDAHVIGKYMLSNQQDSIFASGYYTLLWKKVDGKWLIAVDQTCG
jgi:ketosteroid isomerase-like protein